MKDSLDDTKHKLEVAQAERDLYSNKLNKPVEAVGVGRTINYDEHRDWPEKEKKAMFIGSEFDSM